MDPSTQDDSVIVTIQAYGLRIIDVFLKCGVCGRLVLVQDWQRYESTCKECETVYRVKVV